MVLRNCSVDFFVYTGSGVIFVKKNYKLAGPLAPGEGVDLRVMGLLLRAGADINQRNLAGFTPLHQAAKRGAYSTCKKKAGRSFRLSCAPNK